MQRLRNYLLLVILCIAIAGCTHDIAGQIQPTDLSQEKIEGLTIGTNINDEAFIEQYGKRMVRTDRDVQGLVFYQLNSALEIGVKSDDHTLSRIIVESDPTFKAKTVKGITVGSTKQQVITAYGEHFYQRDEQGLNVIGYTDSKEKRVLEFWMQNDLVYLIHFDATQ